MMGSKKLFAGIVTIILYVAVLVEYGQLAAAAPGRSGGTALENGHRIRNRPFLRIPARPVNQYPRNKQDISEFIVDDDDFFELNKRQTSDDYGHLRFGKREDFDDYGHMRFGRNSETK